MFLLTLSELLRKLLSARLPMFVTRAKSEPIYPMLSEALVIIVAESSRQEMINEDENSVFSDNYFDLCCNRIFSHDRSTLPRSYGILGLLQC